MLNVFLTGCVKRPQKWMYKSFSPFVGVFSDICNAHLRVMCYTDECKVIQEELFVIAREGGRQWRFRCYRRELHASLSSSLSKKQKSMCLLGLNRFPRSCQRR